MPGSSLARSLTAAALALVALPASGAHAAPRACPLVVDALGDGRPTLVPIYSGQLDIVDINIASGQTTVVTRMHVASLARDVLTTFGITWAVQFRIGTSRYATVATRGSAGDTASVRGADGVPHPATLVLDNASATVTVTAPRSFFPELATTGQVFDQIGGSTGWYTNNADSAGDFNARYRDRSPGCIPAA